MSDAAETGLLQDIRSNPDDDTPRLIYSDWLDEHGQSARAELIRIQCEAAQLPKDDKHRQALEARARRLEDAHLDQWVGPLKEHLGGLTPYFYRGFPRFVLVRVNLFRKEPFRKMLAEWLPKAGAMVLSISDPNRTSDLASLLPAIVDSPALAAVHTLSLRKLRPIDDDLRLLAESPHVANLRTLEIY